MNNKKEGYGKYMISDQSCYYEGMLKNDKPDGYGILIQETGDCYVGMWKEGKAHGEGRFQSSNGVIFLLKKKLKLIFQITYDGEWKNDMQDGQGIETQENGAQ